MSRSKHLNGALRSRSKQHHAPYDDISPEKKEISRKLHRIRCMIMSLVAWHVLNLKMAQDISVGAPRVEGTDWRITPKKNI